MFRRIRNSAPWLPTTNGNDTKSPSAHGESPSRPHTPDSPSIDPPKNMSREGSESVVTAPATRERRSKANSKKAWASLMPAKRGHTSEEDEDHEQEEPPKKQAPTPRATAAAKRAKVKKESASPAPAKGAPAAAASASTPQVKKESPPPPLTPQSEKGESEKPAVKSSATPQKMEDLVPDHETGMNKLSKMDEGSFDDDDDMDDDEDSRPFVDDPNDEDFGYDMPVIKPKTARGGAGRGGRAAASPAVRGGRGRGRGGAAVTPAPRAAAQKPVTPAAAGPPPTLRAAPTASATGNPLIVSRGVLSSTGKPLKIVKLNGASMRGGRLVGGRIVPGPPPATTTSAASAAPGPGVPVTVAPTTSAVSGFRPVSGGAGDGAVSSMASSASKEVAEITQKYKDRVVPGHSVAEFNKIVETLKGELLRIAEDRMRMSANHRETVDHMQLSYSTLIDLKDSRIRQLEQQIEQLQKKLQTSVDNHLTQLVGNEAQTLPKGSDALKSANGKQPVTKVTAATAARPKLAPNSLMDFEDEGDDDLDGLNADESYLQESD